MAVISLYENPDLKRERQSCHFDKEEITHLIDGGVEKTKYRRELGKIFFLILNLLPFINYCAMNLIHIERLLIIFYFLQCSTFCLILT